MRKLLLLAALFCAGWVSAQLPTPSPPPTASPSPTPSNAAGFWRATLPGGVYLVRLENIQSISIHEYTIEPLTRVTEMTVETLGPVVARFYYLETGTPQSPLGIGQTAIELLKEKTEEVAKQLAGSDDVWSKVIKTYPVTTHAHTVEYRLNSKAALTRLFKHADRCWTTGKGDAIQIK